MENSIKIQVQLIAVNIFKIVDITTLKIKT